FYPMVKKECSESTHRGLEELARVKDYFALRDKYLAECGNLSPRHGLLWQAVFHNLFGSDYLSLRAAERFLSLYGERDEDAGEMIYISALDRLRRFRYRAAAADYRKLLGLHRQGMDSEEIEEARNNLMLCRALKDVPPQIIEPNGVRRIPLVKTHLGHLTAKVESGGHTGNFIVDTGANFSTVSCSAARSMGLGMAASKIEVGTATGLRIECALAHAPLMDISGIAVRNAVFIVMDDSHLDFSPIGYSIEGIIGLPVIRGLGDVQFTPEALRIGHVRIPRSVHRNICLEGLMPVAEVYGRGQRLSFTLDTGANQSEYSFGYYDRNSKELGRLTDPVSGLRGGGGGVVENSTLLLKDEPLGVGGRRLTSAWMSVSLDDYEFSRGKDGNLGLDALMSNGGFPLSFRRMALYPAKEPK
ncbi:MAG: retroviral-like aspartic protease family protein, partial [Rikenellaceae bacterium]|nr:retroviral-like aspartic protease family protein [Rikenellaceae bacterium]